MQGGGRFFICSKKNATIPYPVRKWWKSSRKKERQPQLGISSVWDDFINTDVSLGLEARPGAGFYPLKIL